MTPLAQQWMRQAILPAKHRDSDVAGQDFGDVLSNMEDVHCFALDEVESLSDTLAEHMRDQGYIDGRLAFLPAKNTWIEYKFQDEHGSGRGAILLLASDGGDWATEISVLGMTSTLSGMLPLKKGATLGSYEGMESVDSAHRHGGIVAYQEKQAKIYAYLSLINTPRVVGRRQHQPHAGLQRDIARSKGMVGKFPLRAWTEIKLEVAAPKWASEKDHETHLTGEKALHFCRSHLRVRLGRVEFVTSHWRGNPAMGIKQSRYAVVPNKGSKDE